MAELLPSRYFPPADSAGPEGLVGIGGELTPAWLVDAYAHGIFPWPLGDEEAPLAWWSLDPRAIFEFDGFHISRRLRRTLKSGRFEVSCNRDFAGVISRCARVHSLAGGTWITPEMQAAYIDLHDRGIAHSVEVWHEGELVGGVYGVAIGALFAAESMFHTQRDASKVALAALIKHVESRGYMLFDIQQLTDHTASLGAAEISRTEYLNRLAPAVLERIDFGKELELPEW